jgi:hypothetical protein
MAHSTHDLTAVLANLDPGMCRGGSCACLGVASRVVVLEFLLGRRPYASSRIRLTGDRELYNGRRGGVPSTRVPTVLEMALQCPGWWHSDGDGCTGPEVTEEMRSIILMSWRRPGLAPGQWSYTFRGRHRPFSRVRHGGRTVVGSIVPRSDTGHPAQYPHNIGDGCTSAGWSNSAGI